MRDLVLEVLSCIISIIIYAFVGFLQGATAALFFNGALTVLGIGAKFDLFLSGAIGGLIAAATTTIILIQHLKR